MSEILQLQKELEDFAKKQGNLKKRLKKANQAFVTSDILPPIELANELISCCQQFISLRQKVRQEAKLSGILPIPKEKALDSLRKLDMLLKKTVDRINQQQEAEITRIQIDALSVLDRVLAIDHSENSEFPSLVQCQEQARELQQTISQPETQLPSEAEMLASGEHPWVALLKLISDRESPDYEYVEELRGTVAQSLGMSLAIAALTGQLTFVSESKSSPTEIEEVDTETPTNTPTSEPETDLRDTPSVEEPPTPGQTRPSLEPPSEVTTEQLSATQEIAISILESDSQENAQALHDLIWQLICEDKLGLAFHLGRCLEHLFPEFEPRVPSWLIRGVAIGRHVRYDLGVGEIANILIGDFARFSDRDFIDSDISLLLAASTLRPALLAPKTNASDPLNYLRLGEGFNQLFEYCQTIAEYGSQRRALNPTAIKNVRSQKDWDADMKCLQHDVEEWLAKAPGLTMIYGVTGKVWKKWLQSGGLVDSLLKPVRENNKSQLTIVEQNVKELSSESKIHEEIRKTEKELGANRRDARTIGKALNRICISVKEAIEFARRWIELQESLNYDSSQKRIQQIKQDLSSRHNAVLEELDSFIYRESSASVLAGISCCKTAVEDIRTLFNPDALLPTGETKLKYVLHADLLKVTALPMNDDWEPEIPLDRSFLNKILSSIAQNYSDWQQAFEAQSESRNHEATERIIEYLKAYPEASIEIDNLQELRDESLKECQDCLKRDIKETRKTIESAVSLGILQEVDRADYESQIVDVENIFDLILRFYQKQNELSQIKTNIENKTQKEIENIKRRLDSLSLTSDRPDYQRIHELLDSGDIFTSNEYIDMVERGDELPLNKVKEIDRFSDFFPRKAIDIASFMEDTKPKSTIRKIKSRESFCGVDLRRLTGAQTDRAAEMIEAWFNAKRAGVGRNPLIDKDDARTILESLGFNPVDINVTPSRSRTCWLNITTEVIRDKELCPVSAYGSDANGQYRILCVWERPTVDDIIHDVKDTAQGSPTLVFFFGRLTERWRRELARTCRERRRTFVLIDDLLMLYLCGEAGSRLPTLFKCALPFTFLEPYATTAGLVPPEIFYGRKQERDSIINPMGSCFIYGGRQLGKTALLRSVEREFHAPEDGKIAYWMDLNARGMVKKLPIEDIWTLLANVFKDFEVVPRTTPSNAGADTLLRHITTWLDRDKNRRILLLLDEADLFLESDGTKSNKTDSRKGGFIQTSYLKGWMDRTDRRFKVVFAGLHNVQRTTRLENQPLAHYGKPLCIGPLLDDGEWREARNLIEQPFASIGYRLSDDLVTRILSQTNYYPSLIQLYCKELLRYVNKNNLGKFDSSTTPPYQITEHQVDEVYQSKNLRHAIRERFKWTLQLDERYEVIAYAIAYESLENQQGMVEGFSVSWLHDDVLDWWPKGFQDKETDEIRALLEEMVGLGVLRETQEDYYALRSPNVLLLLGTKEQIEEQLTREREAPPEFQPGTFRSALTDDISRRSPLTVQQESMLREWKNGVSIVFGSPASGLDELAEFLVSAVGAEFFISLEQIASLEDFAARLGDEINNRPRDVDGINIILVSADCTWDTDWVESALKKVKQLTSPKSFVRICFIANPQKTWDLFRDTNQERDSIVAKGIVLTPWHDDTLRQWLEDCNFTAMEKESRTKITDVTGNWPILLKRFYQKCQSDVTSWERNLQDLENSLDRSEFARSIANSLGLEDIDPQCRQVLRVLKTLEEASEEDLIGIEEGISADIVRKTLEWARHLHLVLPKGKGNWCVDPLLARILTSTEE
ncbi:MAG: hypothetical protein SWY16_20120 [Cyanobacteriota bacterium]|nr:hypothetical protein [Cyanobacteriota bacterium]